MPPMMVAMGAGHLDMKSGIIDNIVTDNNLIIFGILIQC
jgi:hypothetical protein